MTAKPPVRIFLSSPGDAAQERRMAQRVVTVLNRRYNLPGWPILKTIRWPEDLLPGAGYDAQGVINRQVPDYDIYLGVFRNRFGTPTLRAGSGTEEELDSALEMHHRGSLLPKILLYFSNIPVAPLAVDPNQLILIQYLKDRVHALGVLTQTYDSLGDFRDQVTSHLDQLYRDIVLTRTPKRRSSSRRATATTSRTVTLGDYSFNHNITYPQWADPHVIPLAQFHREAITITGQLITSSSHFRFGFKLKEARESAFGPGNVLTAGQNILLHLGKNDTHDDLFFTYYRSGIRLEPDRPFKPFVPGRPLAVEVSYRPDGLVTFAVDALMLMRTHYPIAGPAHLLMLAWGDEHQYACQLTSVTIVATRWAP